MSTTNLPKTPLNGNATACEITTHQFNELLTRQTRADGRRYVSLLVCVTPDGDGCSELMEMLDALSQAQYDVLSQADAHTLDEEDKANYERLDLLRQSLTAQAVGQLGTPVVS